MQEDTKPTMIYDKSSIELIKRISNIISLRIFASYFNSLIPNGTRDRLDKTMIVNYLLLERWLLCKNSFAETIINYYLLFSLMTGSLLVMEELLWETQTTKQMTILREIDRLNRIIVLQIEWETLFLLFCMKKGYLHN